MQDNVVARHCRLHHWWFVASVCHSVSAAGL